MKEIERKLVRKEREERRRNVVMKVVKVKDGKRKEAAEETLKEIGAKVKIDEVMKVKDGGERGTEIIWVKIENEEQKEVMRRKKELREKKERILEDLTWEERKMKWGLKNNSKGGKEKRRESMGGIREDKDK